MITRSSVIKGVLAALFLMPCFSFVSEAASLTPPKPKASQAKYSGYVRVSWSKVSKSNGYVIKRGTSSAYSSASIITIISSKSTTSYKDKTAAIGQVYYYWVCPLSSSTEFWYNASRYAKGYRKLKSAWGAVSGSSSVNANTRNSYYLYVNGKLVQSSSVTWKVSGTGASVTDNGYYGSVYATRSGTVTVKATYLGKTFSKKITVKANSGLSNGGSSSASLSIVGPSSVSLGSSATFSLKKGGKYVTGGWYTYSSQLYMDSYNTPWYTTSAKFHALSPGTATVYVIYGGKTYQFYVTVTSSGYNGGGSSGGSGVSISGPSELKKGKSGYYYLYVGGKKVSASWSSGGTSITVYNSGGAARVVAGNPPVSAGKKFKTSIRAKYNGKTYSKTIYIYK